MDQSHHSLSSQVFLTTFLVVNMEGETLLVLIEAQLKILFWQQALHVNSGTGAKNNLETRSPHTPI